MLKHFRRLRFKNTKGNFETKTDFNMNKILENCRNKKSSGNDQLEHFKS